MSRSARESDVIRWIASRSASLGRGPDELSLVRGIGDDAAILQASEGALVVTTDLLVEGVHFLLAEAGAERIGRKAMAVSLSDIAAMGARPAHAFLSAGLPPRFREEDARLLFEGAAGIAERFETCIAGGDTTRSDDGLVINVTLIGVAPTGGAVRRDGARPGDLIVVTGALGGSIGGHHLDFEPRVDEGRWLAEHGGVTAMIDLSDGLSTDLLHILDESAVGASLEADRIPLSDGLDSEGDEAVVQALNDGEDFELLFTVAPDSIESIRSNWPFATPLSEIGSISTEEEGRSLVGREAGRTTPLKAGGHEHTCR